MSADWERQNERASGFMLQLLVTIARYLGRSVARLILWPSVAYFLLTAREQRRASRAYLRRVLGRAPSLRDLWRHFHTFGICALDRVFLLAGVSNAIRVQVHRDAAGYALTRGSGGCVVLLAHVGSFETIRVEGSVEHRLPLSVVMDRAHGRMYSTLLERLNPEIAARIIDASARGPDLVLKMKAALERGDLVCLMADRARAGEPTVGVELFGATAQLPLAPWVIASALKVPVVMGLGLYRGNGQYDAYIEGLAERVSLDRRDRAASAQAYAQAYANRLQAHLQSAPYNWANFYDFWGEQSQ
ncbi:lipid A biosynthesis acyltransferase [Sinimarinibacterium sp. CAU 1509]|uniref:lipid A biosynthesis acyltransferase n=1 Tax=Sinimarinibacterium sp. CAU 1509 TaxID=2562283 RepID=UPI0010AD4743|nr:lipid A biosynthesis acyltransferase [Sinimarinibacterium sp. CAU 1509]TJY58300.1 lipid A biosynthesis acyltransferase [Sinimarinibacterium sp. CAU 1509]